MQPNPEWYNGVDTMPGHMPPPKAMSKDQDSNIGRKLIHTISGHGGVVDAEAEHPNGDVLVRLNDQWFMLHDCVEWEG